MDKLTGHGHPSKHLVGKVGQHYEDLDTGDIYECRIANKHSHMHGWPVGGYIWELRAKGEDIEEFYGQGGSGGNSPYFGEETKEVVIIPETTFLPENIMGSSGISIANPELITFIEGQTYTVIYDNNTYEVIAAPEENLVALRLEDVNVAIAVVPGAEDVFTVLTPDGYGVEHIIKVTTIETVITKIDSKFMPDGYPRTETKEVTFLPETSVNFDIDLSDGLIQCSMSGSFEAIKPGKTYVVTVNGKSYICKADGGVVDNIYEVGQIGVMPDEEFNESMPFQIFTHSQWSGDIMFVTRSDLLPNPSTFTIVEIEEIIKPLDPKYLPGGGALVVSFTNNGDFVFVSSHTGAEILSAAAKGAHVVGTIVGGIMGDSDDTPILFYGPAATNDGTIKAAVFTMLKWGDYGVNFTDRVVLLVDMESTSVTING